MNLPITRRASLATLATGAVAATELSLGRLLAADEQPGLRLAAFAADVTPPLGHPLLAGWRSPAKKIVDRLSALGLVLLPKDEKPMVLVAFDWCELRNDAYDLCRSKLADAAGTTRERVLVHTVHQHDAPYVDLAAQVLLDEAGLPGAMFQREFVLPAIDAVAAACRKSLAAARPATHLGIGQAKIEQVASNRRVELPGRPPNFGRYSAMRDAAMREAPAGEIDPQLKTISFWDGDRPLAAVSSYAVHPMSYYGSGEVSCDFVGLAREKRRLEMPDVFQMYLSGCCGDVTAGKYNEGSSASRLALTKQMHQGLTAAWEETKRAPLERVTFRVAKLKFEPETAGGLAPENLRAKLADKTAPLRERVESALGLSWQARCARGETIDVPAIDFGAAQLVLCPAESFVRQQLLAQRARPNSFVMAAGFGESAPGYIPTEDARREGFVREHGYCWVQAGAEPALNAAIAQALGATAQEAPR